MREQERTAITTAVSEKEIRSALDSVLHSAQFRKSPRVSRFLRFVVEESLRGAASSLKEYAIGVEVFDRGADFDPRIETVVRVVAVQLRSRLRSYYLGPGDTDPIRIEIPKGSYAPHFRRQAEIESVLPVTPTMHPVELKTAHCAPNAMEEEDGNSAARIIRRLSAKPSATDSYVRARRLLELPDLRSKQEAIALLKKATSQDEQFPLPWLSLARAEMFAAMAGLEAPAGPVQRALAALTRALQLDPDLAEAHTLLAIIAARHEWNWTRAKLHFDCALRLAPFSAETHAAFAAEYLAPLGLFDEALGENRRALQLDPFSVLVKAGRGYILALGRRFSEASDEFRQLSAEHRDFPGMRGGLAFALWGQGRFEEAMLEFEAIAPFDPGTGQTKVFVAVLRALLGTPDAAVQLRDELHNEAVLHFVPAMHEAHLCISLGDHDSAFLTLQRAQQNREDALRHARVAFTFDPLREDPRFLPLLLAAHLK